MLSYWERESFTRYDHIVVGAGITGLSVAIELKETFPKQSVLILERGLLPTGATTRNAGFACMGSATELLSDLQTHSEEDVIKLFIRRKTGLDILRKRLSDKQLGYKADGGYELLTQKDLSALDKLDYLNKLLRPYLATEAFIPSNELIDQFGFSRNHVAALISNTCEGSIDSGKAMRSLTDLALSKGIEIKTGANLLRYAEEESQVVLEIGDPCRKDPLYLHSQTISICTNAFTKQLLPSEDVTPGRGQILITNPIPGLRLKGIFHYDAGYYYFRELDGRVLIGGARNLSFVAEQTTDFELTEIIQNDLEDKLREMILPGVDFTIDMRWAGIMAFGAAKAPIVKAFSERVFGAFRMGGMGVALGSGVAKELAFLIGSTRMGITTKAEELQPLPEAKMR